MQELYNRLRWEAFRPARAFQLQRFRLLFGLALTILVARYFLNGWIRGYYIDPDYHFHFCFLPLEPYTSPGLVYAHFAAALVCAVLVLFGLFYRFALLGFIVFFGSIFLWDVTYFLNHHYLILLLSWLMLWVPAGLQKSPERARYRPRNIHIWLLRLQFCIVWFYAGVAKLNPYWLLDGQPLTLWLKARSDLPLGGLFEYSEMGLIMSWAGMLFDLIVPFALWFRGTRVYAIGVALAFHLMTAALFQIGMFPWIMLCGLTLFLPVSALEQRAFRGPLRFLVTKFRLMPFLVNRGIGARLERIGRPVLFRLGATVLLVHFLIQLWLPVRYLPEPVPSFWSEDHFRFSWKIMIVQKSGYVAYRIRLPSGKDLGLDPRQDLNPIQYHMLSYQPDLIVQYGRFIGNRFLGDLKGASANAEDAGVRVFVDSYASMNGRPSQPFFRSDVDLMQIHCPGRYAPFLYPAPAR